MKRRSLLLLCVMLATGYSGFGQSKSVTNADLDKFKEKRLNAEKHYRENYERLGLPSPEELDKRRIQDAKDREELSNRLRRERLEREQIEAEQRAREKAYRSEIRQYQILTEYVPAYGYGSGYYSSGYGYGYSYGRRYPRAYPNGRFYRRQEYRATPVGIYPIQSPRFRPFQSPVFRRRF